MRSGPATTRQSLVAWSVVVIAGGFLAVTAVASLLRTPTDDIDGAAEQYEQLLCVEDLMHEQIPAGASVAISRREAMMAADPTLSDISASYWYQRLTELAYPGYDPAIAPLKAEFAVGLAVPFGAGECGGVGLQVTEQQ